MFVCEKGSNREHATICVVKVVYFLIVCCVFSLDGVCVSSLCLIIFVSHLCVSSSLVSHLLKVMLCAVVDHGLTVQWDWPLHAEETTPWWLFRGGTRHGEEDEERDEEENRIHLHRYVCLPMFSLGWKEPE